MASILLLAVAAAVWPRDGVADVALEGARAAFCAGDWREAALASEAVGGPEGFLLASDSWRLHGRYGGVAEDGREAAYARAVEAADRGLAEAPKDSRLLVALSAALARRCSLNPFRCILDKEDLERSRRALEAAQAADPDNPAIRAFLGAWYVRAGAAGFLTGIRSADGRHLLLKAQPELDGNAPVLFEVARAWRDLGEKVRALEAFHMASEAPAECAWEKAVARRARQHFRELARGG